MLKLISFLGAMFIRSLYATLRVRHVNSGSMQELRQYIFAFWHDHLLLMLHARYRRPISVIISQSRDGEMIARVFDWYDVRAARGSSTRGGSAALREMIRDARQGKNIAFTPDGPKGPPRVLKEGVIAAARATGLPIVPVAFAAKKKSYCDRGIEWSCRTRSRVRSSFTAIPSSCRVRAIPKSGDCGWSGP